MFPEFLIITVYQIFIEISLSVYSLVTQSHLIDWILGFVFIFTGFFDIAPLLSIWGEKGANVKEEKSTYF